jgi:hypothetical protein
MIIKDRGNNSYLGTFVSAEKSDTDKVAEIIRTVTLMNKQNAWGYRTNGTPIKKRICKRGRKAITKMMAPKGYFTSGSKGLVNYNSFGNLMGGIKNAAEFDVYLYDRSTYYYV